MLTKTFHNIKIQPEVWEISFLVRSTDDLECQGISKSSESKSLPFSMNVLRCTFR